MTTAPARNNWGESERARAHLERHPLQSISIHEHIMRAARGGWSYYYMHGTAPITQHGRFNPVQPTESADHILPTSKTIHTDVRHQECAFNNNSIM